MGDKEIESTPRREGYDAVGNEQTLDPWGFSRGPYHGLIDVTVDRCTVFQGHLNKISISFGDWFVMRESVLSHNGRIRYFNYRITAVIVGEVKCSEGNR